MSNFKSIFGLNDVSCQKNQALEPHRLRPTSWALGIPFPGTGEPAGLPSEHSVGSRSRGLPVRYFIMLHSFKVSNSFSSLKSFGC